MTDPARRPGEQGQRRPGEQGQTALKERVSVRRPRLYRVLLLNDDYTPMDFVVQVLAQYFGKDDAAAQRIMLAVHHQGQGLAGVYPREVAESKVAQVTAHARAEGHPLRLRAEPEPEGAG